MGMVPIPGLKVVDDLGYPFDGLGLRGREQFLYRRELNCSI